MDNNKNDAVQKWTEIGANIVASSLTSVAGILNPTIEGAILSTVGGTLFNTGLQLLGRELQTRYMSKKEEQRIGTAFYYLQQKFNENADAGKAIRDDDFFNTVDGEYSTNLEILEGILIAAQKSYQEKKVRHISNFYANLLFDNTIDGHKANHFLKLAESMSYRQFCLLAVYYYGIDFGLDKRSFAPTKREIRLDTISDLKFLNEHAFIILEIPLENQGKFFMFPPENAALSNYGQTFCELFALDKLLEDDLLDVAGQIVTAEKIEEVRTMYKQMG